MGIIIKKRHLLGGIFLFLLIVVGFFVIKNVVWAQATSYSIEDIGGSVGLATVDLKTLVINIIKWVLGLVSLVAVSYLIYGGVLWLTSRGNEEKIAKAKKTIINAVIGVIIVLLAWAIVLLVNRFITNAGGGGSISCTANVDRDPANPVCRVCNNLGNGYIQDPAQLLNPLCSFPGVNMSFYVRDLQTSNENFFPNNEKLYLCSGVKPLFNHVIDPTTIVSAASASPPTLLIEKLSCSISVGQPCWTDNDCFLISGNAADLCQGTFVDGTWTPASESAIYKHLKVCSNDPSQTCKTDGDCGAGNTCDLVLFEKNSNYALHLPYDIKDKAGRNLSYSLSSPVYCQYDDAVSRRITCRFSTGDQNDTTPPEVTTTEPINTGPGYPDRNVDRDQSINVNFSESIDITTVIDTNNLPRPNLNNVFIQKLDAQGGTPQPGGDLDTDGDPENKLDADKLIIQEKSAGFRLYLNPGLNFESWTWYRVTVQNVEDLCGNALVAPVVWEFKTNDAVAGIRSVYPTGNNVCPDEHIIVVFNTSMFNNVVSFQVDSQQIIMPPASSWPFPPQPTYTVTINDADPNTLDGTLKITDYESGDPLALDPDKKFRIFDLKPEEPLASNADHTVTVTTDKVIDTAGTVLSKTWTFHVTTADQCTCEPLITALRPSEGGVSECITIQGRCFDGTTKHAATPQAVHFDAAPTNVEAWGTDTSGNDYVVTTSPAGALDDRPQVTVDIHYDEAAYGDMTSNGETYWYKTTDVSNGPCLYSIATRNNRCWPGTPATLKGIRFRDGAADATRTVTFAAGPFSSVIAPADWKETEIKTAIPAAATEDDDGDVFVTNDNGDSNSIFYNICEPDPKAPRVKAYGPTCTAVCPNAGLWLDFNEVTGVVEMNTANFNNGHIHLADCGTEKACEIKVDVPLSGFIYDSTFATDTGRLTFAPSASLDSNTYYQVIVDNTVVSTDDVALANLNYDRDNDGIDDGFAWVFKTKDDSSLCALARVGVRPLTKTLRPTQTAAYYADPFGSPDSCDARGQLLVASAYNWDWVSSLPAVATITNTIAPTQTALAVNDGTTQITATANSISGRGTLTVDSIGCSTSVDCSINERGEACPGSQCVNNKCSPVFLASPEQFNPADGAPETWVTIKGCWFGAYVAGQSKVNFDADEGLIPDEAACHPTNWSNNRIVREVPAAALPGNKQLTVIRSDGQTVASTDTFSVNALQRPGICALSPSSGKEGDTIQVIGKLFGATRDDVVNDKVIFTGRGRCEAGNVCSADSPNPGAGCLVDFDCSVPVDASTYPVWSDTNIRVNVPANAHTGDIKVKNNPAESNDWPFTVTGTGGTSSTCARTCINDTSCTTFDPNQGCGYDKCCYDKPTIVTSLPTNNAIDVCLNTKIKITFNEAMDVKTFNNNGILFAWWDGSTWNNIPLAGKIKTADKSFSIVLNELLRQNTRYRIQLHATNIRSKKGVSLGVLTTITFTTADTAGACKMAKVVIDPSSHLFTAKTDTQNFIAEVQDAKNNPLNEITGVYEWSWQWSSDDSLITSITNSDADTQTATPQKNGRTALKATATEVGASGLAKTGKAAVTVNFCDMPWEYHEPAVCNPVLEDCSIDFHFDLFYCRGQYGTCEGTNLNCSRDYVAVCPVGEKCCPITHQTCNFKPVPLSDFDQKVIRGKSGRILRQYLIKESDPEKKDAIGLRIYANSEGLSPYDWYKNNIDNPGSPASLSVDGYPAVKDGRTVYVAATNIDYGAGTVYHNIYILSYNDDAAAETKNIYNQLLKNWNFNNNIVDPADKELIIRDLKRINDLRTIQGYLEKYRLTHATAIGVNLVQNSGFEAGLTAWQTGGVVEVTQAEKHEGNSAVHVSSDAYVKQDFAFTALEKGKTYEVSGWLKSDLAAGAHGYLLAQCIDAAGNLMWEADCGFWKDASPVLTSETDWTKASVIVTPLKTDRRLRVTCSVVGTGDLYCDDLQVKEVSAPYPLLQAGTYLTNMSTSRWPSWQATLGNALGKTLPLDPIEKITCIGNPSDKGACWDEPTKVFTCDPGSYLYAYQTNQGLNYRLYAHFEYSGSGSWININPMAGTNICGSYTPVSDCRCFNYRLTGP